MILFIQCPLIATYVSVFTVETEEHKTITILYKYKLVSSAALNYIFSCVCIGSMFMLFVTVCLSVNVIGVAFCLDQGVAHSVH